VFQLKLAQADVALDSGNGSIKHYRVATSYYFVSAPADEGVLEWFRTQPEVAVEWPNERRVLLFFSQFGPLAIKPDGEADAYASPLVSVYLPKLRRGVLWTVGEVHFLYKPSKRFSQLETIRKRFQTWISQNEMIWDRAYDGKDGYGFYMEGGIKNIAEKIYAFPAGLAAHEAGQYFIAERDNDFVLDRVCRSLRLRGVDCSP
jgi:hypothetical protein